MATSKKSPFNVKLGVERKKRMIFWSEDLLVDILSRLPTPDLCRCRCVSNQWHRRLVPSILAQRSSLPLTENTLMNVLSRLPPADLCRCKCVCKDWRRRLIPHATSLRPNLALVNFMQSPTFISFSEDDGSVHNDPSLPSPSLCSSLFEDEEGAARFLGVCNGMAFASRGWAYQPSRGGSWNLPRHPFCHYFHVTRYVLLNPLTGQVSTIPPPPPPDACPYGFNFLAFDPRSSSVHFKIISVKLGDADHATPYLYSSLAREWRPLDMCEEKSSTPHRMDPYRMDPYPEQSYCLDGVAYRFAGDSDALPPGYAQKNIMALDVKEEHLFWITSPMVPKDSRETDHSLGESVGYLRYAFHVIGKSLSTWLLDAEWTYVHKINLEDAEPPLLRSFFSFAFHPLDANLIFVNYMGLLFIANLDNLELRQVTDRDDRLYMGILCPYVCPR